MESGMKGVSQYVSTVFACDTSVDNRYVRCDFSQCEEHNKEGGKPEWILNTHKNVKMLERHVGQKVYQYVLEYERLHGTANKESFEYNVHLLDNPTLMNKYSKIIIFLNLRDQQAELGLWIQAFLDAAAANAGSLHEPFCTVTMSFSSRLELMNCIGKLSNIKENNSHADVMIILSCHSSNQGQVFSCTPTYISANSSFEEFCSLHDFVRTCQDVLPTMLKVLHISSCFTLKLDNSLEEWPVCYTWYREELNCTLCGSTKEIYETGSQVADLYLVLSIFVNQHQGSLKSCFDAAVSKAVENDWPDLANEMGLTVVNDDSVEATIKLPADEDKVTPPSVIFSPIHVLLITMDENVEEFTAGVDYSSKAECDNWEDRLLADAILKNLNVRKSSDINAKFSRVSLSGKLNDIEVIEKLQGDMTEESSRELLFVFIGKRFGKISKHIYESMRIFCFENDFKVYGMHFQSINVVSWRTLSLQISDKLSRQACCTEEFMKSSFPVTGSLSCDASCVEKYPLILYLIHLVVGENGLRRLKKADNEEKGRKFSSKWSLTDVYMETSYVLSGLSRNCDLKLISPESIYRRCNWNLLKNPKESQSCSIHGSSFSEKIGIENAFGVTRSFVSCSDSQHFTLHTNEDMRDCSQDHNGPDTIIENSGAVARKRKLEDCFLGHREKLKVNKNDCQMQTSECIESLAKSNETDENIQNNDLGFNSSLGTKFDLGTVLSSDSYVKSDLNAGKSGSVNMARINNDLDAAAAVDGVDIDSKAISAASPRHSECIERIENYSSKSINPTSNLDYSKDLPLMANVDDVLVKHYILDLDVDFQAKVISGTIVLFIEPARLNANQCNFQMCLDSTMVTIDAAVEVPLPNDLEIHFHNKKCCCAVVKDKEAPSYESFVLSNKVPHCSNCSDGSPQSWGSSFQSSNLENAQRHGINEEDHSCRNGSVMSDFNSQFENDPSIVCDNDSQDVNSSSSLEAGKADCSCGKKINSRDAPSKMVFECRHCQFLHDLRGSKRNISPLKFKKLAYSIHGWCIRVWKEGDDANIWPRCIKLWYRTSPDGQSIMWAKDQDGKDAVFTPGAYINNRSLMPCQEPPIAMSTWQAYFHVNNGATVLMSGDHYPCKEDTLRKILDDPGLFYYEMSLPLPCSTLALAIGTFIKSSIEIDVKAGPSGKVVPVAMYASKSRINDFRNEFMELACDYLTAASELLGDYPFSRLDLVLMPRCFACMGLESPNLAFLSQSLLCGDRSMSVRIAHEIAHAWFGLLIGVKDWTEEWLSEGFATYLEERIQARVDKLSSVDELNCVRLRQAIRYRSLKSELTEAEDNLKSLRPRPAPSGYVSAAEAIRRNIAGEAQDDPSPHTLLTGALIPSRKWTQVHYLKGYFLLYHLSQMVGQGSFDRFLRSYIERYRECLVSSEMFFSMFADHFKISTGTKDQIMRDWLDSSGIPREVDKILADNLGTYVLQVNEKFLEWKKRDTGNKRCQTLKQKRKKLTRNSSNHSPLTADQMILLLEKLLERDTLSHRTLKDLQFIHSLDSCNAEIRHRWCELIVKHKYCKGYDQVRQFLVEDQGMGIYLFGELLISEDAKQKRIADEVFEEIKNEMDGCTYQTVYEMLNGI